MVVLKIVYKRVKVIQAEINNEAHKKGIWSVKNENLDYSIVTNKFIPYEEHNKWWDTIFDDEYIFVIVYESEVCGYIRLTKKRTSFKEKNEISISLAKKFQDSGLGSYAYNLFEAKMKKNGINQIIALTHINNELGKKFFEKNKFKNSGVSRIKNYIRYVKKL